MGKFALFFGILLVNFTGAAAELSRNYLLSLAQTTLAGGDIHPADFTPLLWWGFRQRCPTGRAGVCGGGQQLPSVITQYLE